jgi:hypothetical protein
VGVDHRTLKASMQEVSNTLKNYEPSILTWETKECI